MASWRDTTPDAVLADLDGLVTAALKSAQALLTKNKGFAPYGLLIDDAGNLAPLKPADDAMDSPETILDSLYLKAAARDDVRAVAFVADITYNGADAVRAAIEHRDGGPALSVVAPYTSKDRATSPVTYGDLEIVEAVRRTWV